jgi:hypothetical protein
MAMVPHERSLVKRLESKPFVLLGVNLDESKEDEKKSEEKNKISWRSWFDGRSGPISEKWKIRYLPAIYILDDKGVIRYKGLRDEAMDKAVDKLLAEAAGKKP